MDVFWLCSASWQVYDLFSGGSEDGREPQQICLGGSAEGFHGGDVKVDVEQFQHWLTVLEAS